MTQGSTCKDLGHEGQRAIITPKAADTPLPKRAGFRGPYKKVKILV
ncbi:acetyltransferase [Lacticaseibacillus rhamnosus]|uniref:Acetyltransferase n=1 Tax=Lacticaseibacillus rhamnosus TaxID=47715 RepID=A0AB74IG45_LACRH|nr:acetyltransferase [Lacticaseibacillus rhamnosus]MCT3151442.1 acetyltransferase [Lacticaseibacillus rhamnosus]MCT3155663.1 acetyltransferase [Lacticaseibacillus rhamnosus]MCT3159835.1 acetyltransferase [Lacticaseibacillus rhamnosus]MCT3187923.1 acetyltransferase [Lacticaseibacillus rhamnosus]